MRILVTGAGGWTARPILEALLRAGHEVVALDLPGYAYHGDGRLHLPARWIEGSVTDLAGVEQAARSRRSSTWQ